MGVKDIDPGEHDVRASGDDFAPEFAARVFHRYGHQVKGAASGIGSNVEDAAGPAAFRARVVVGVILVGVFTMGDQPEFG